MYVSAVSRSVTLLASSSRIVGVSYVSGARVVSEVFGEARSAHPFVPQAHYIQTRVEVATSLLSSSSGKVTAARCEPTTLQQRA